jgi:hypothetical protein
MLARPPLFVSGKYQLSKRSMSCAKLGLWIEIQYSIGIGYWYCSAVFDQYSIGYSIGVKNLV